MRGLRGQGWWGLGSRVRKSRVTVRDHGCWGRQGLWLARKKQEVPAQGSPGGRTKGPSKVSTAGGDRRPGPASLMGGGQGASGAGSSRGGSWVGAPGLGPQDHTATPGRGMGKVESRLAPGDTLGGQGRLITHHGQLEARW